jgi:AcrR family transcriptional regulator
MSPRTRRITNAQLLATAARVVNERGAHHTRLSDIAAVSGLAPATLLQRFGSLEGLLDAVSADFPAQVGEAFEVAGASPVAALEAGLAMIARQRQWVYLVTRPAGAAAWSLELRKHIAFSLAGAVEAGELVHCDVAGLARRIQIGFYGLAVAALLEGGTVDEAATHDLVVEVLGELI